MELVQVSTDIIPRPLIKMGPRYLNAIVDSGTDVCVISSKLEKEKAFQDAAFPSWGHTTINVGGKDYHLHSPYRVLLEVPEKGTAYFETVYVFPLPMSLDMVMCPGMPFSEDMTSLITRKRKYPFIDPDFF